MYSEAGLLPLNRNPESEHETTTTFNNTKVWTSVSTTSQHLNKISQIPVLESEGMVPRERALLRRPGKEEGDALRSRIP